MAIQEGRLVVAHLRAIERARVIRNGAITMVDSMTEVEELEFPAPFGKMEAFQTSGGTSTLPETFLGRVRELDYKTIRYPGHCAKFKTMIDLGLCSSEKITVDGAEVAPRRVLGDLLVRNLPADEPDVVAAACDRIRDILFVASSDRPSDAVSHAIETAVGQAEPNAVFWINVNGSNSFRW